MAELFRRGLRLGPPGFDQVRGGVRQIQFLHGTKNSAADSADCRGTKLFRRGSDRIRGGLAELPPAECTEKGPRETATRIFRECPPRTFEKFRLRGTIPRLTTVPRNHSAANNRVAEHSAANNCAADLFRQRFKMSLEPCSSAYNNQLCRHPMPKIIVQHWRKKQLSLKNCKFYLNKGRRTSTITISFL